MDAKAGNFGQRQIETVVYAENTYFPSEPQAESAVAVASQAETCSHRYVFVYKNLLKTGRYTVSVG